MRLSLLLSMLAVSSLGLVACEGDETCTDACSDSGGSGGTGNGSANGPAGPGGTGAAGVGGSGGQVEGNWVPLITGAWELESGGENTADNRTLVVDRDIYVGAIRPIAPMGTHHTVLGINALGLGNIVYASGVGTNAIVFPKGVGLKIKSGDTLILQLHLFNPTGNTMSGTSGIEVIEVDPADVEEEADLLLAGPLNLDIPPNQVSSKTGVCTAQVTQKVFAIFPHMHQLGSHFKSTLTIGGQPQVIHDDLYEFNHQAFIPMEPITMNPGDTVTTECTWNNSTTDTIHWGESSTTEMCFSILYRYPAQGAVSICGG